MCRADATFNVHFRGESFVIIGSNHMVESNSEVVIDPGGEKFCQILLGSLYEGNKN